MSKKLGNNPQLIEVPYKAYCLIVSIVTNTRSKTQIQVVFGSGIALLSAISFALNLVLADMSYEHGTNIHALNLSRAFGFLTCLILIVIHQHKRIHLPTRIRLACLLIGVLLCAEMYALLGAIRTIPVAMAVLIFYTYPMIIAIYRWLRGQDHFSINSFSLLIIAFIGLIMVLIESTVTLDPVGIGFAVAAAIVMALMLISSEFSLNNYDNHIVLLHVLTIVTAIIIILSISIVELHWPLQPVGWFAFMGSSLFYIIATFCLFKAVSLIGPLKTAIVDNTAPVWAIIFGYLLLEQTLGFQQILGAAVIVGAVISIQWSRKF